MKKTFSARIVPKTCLTALCFTLATLLTAGYAMATSNIVFILDASGSMNGRIGNETKMTAAKRVLSDLLMELPADAQVGLMAYGHTVSKEKAGACEDIAILSPIGQETPQALAQKVNALQPMGMTPIASSLIRSVEAFKGVQGGNNHVVLISDGLETCGRDPCGAAKALTEANIQAKVHVVGFDVGAKEAAELACIPKMGNGKYFRANNIEELKLAIAEIKIVTEVAEVIEEPKVEEPPKKKEEPKPTEYEEVWRDDFDGEELADHWAILQPDPDSFIVEEGKLLMISSTVSNFAKKNIPNIFRLDKDLPKGDWAITAKLDIDFQHRHDRIFFGLHADKDNYLVSILSYSAGQCAPGGSKSLHVNVTPTKVLGGKHTGSPQGAWTTKYCGKPGTHGELIAKGQPYLLRIVKKGRMYTTSIKMEGDEKPKWVEFSGLKLLRPKGSIAIGAYRSHKASGEVTVTVDWIKLEVAKESE